MSETECIHGFHDFLKVRGVVNGRHRDAVTSIPVARVTKAVIQDVIKTGYFQKVLFKRLFQMVIARVFR